MVSSRGPVWMDVFISLEQTPSMIQSGHMEGVCVWLNYIPKWVTRSVLLPASLWLGLVSSISAIPVTVDFMGVICVPNDWRWWASFPELMSLINLWWSVCSGILPIFYLDLFPLSYKSFSIATDKLPQSLWLKITDLFYHSSVGQKFDLVSPG